MSKKIELTSEQQKLFADLKKLSKRANQRILQLERKYGDTLAISNLREKLATEPLQAWTKKGRVSASKKMTLTQMTATIKATEEFLSNKMTTARGIKVVKNKAIETLRVRFSGVAGKLSFKEAESLSNFFNDKDVYGITNFIKGSDVLGIIEDAKEYGDSFEEFRNRMLLYVKLNKGKGNLEQLIRNIYTKYVYKISSLENDIDFLYDNVRANIDNATSNTDLEEIENTIETLRTDERIDDSEYSYLINLILQKRNEL